MLWAMYSWLWTDVHIKLTPTDILNIVVGQVLPFLAGIYPNNRDALWQHKVVVVVVII